MADTPWASDPIVSPSNTAPWMADPIIQRADAAPDKRQTGYIANLGAGGNSALAGAIGLPVDLVTGGINLATRGVNAVAGTSIPPIEHPIGGSDSIKRAMGLVGANPDDVRPDGIGEGLTRGVGAGLVSTTLPTGAAAGLARAGVISAPSAANVVQAMGGITAPNALLGASSGAASEGAASLVPDQYKPLAGIIGGLAGVAIPAAGLAGFRGAWNALSDYAAPAMGQQNILMEGASPILGSGNAPLTASTNQVRIAGQDLSAATSNPTAVRAIIDAPPAPIVPGDNPTMGAMTRDPGLATLEYSASRGGVTQDPAAFRARQDQQNDARVRAIQGVAPEASADAFPPVLRRQADAVDAAAGARVAQVDQQAQASVAGATVAEQAQTDALRQQATTRAAALPGDLPAGSEATIGQMLRQPIQESLAQTKAREGGLWRAIDPDKTLATDMTPIRAKGAEIENGIGPNAAPMSGEEKAIFDVARSLPDVQPFQDLTDFRSRIQSQIRTARAAGSDQEVRRLSMLLDGVHDTMEGSVAGKTASDAAAVQAGTMAPEDAMGGRLANEAAAFQQARRTEARAATGTGDANYAPSGSSGIPSFNRTEVPPGGGAGPAQRSPGLQGSDPLSPNFDEAAQQRYADARQATADRVATYKNAPGVGQALASGPTSGSFRAADSAVPNIIVSVGPKGRDVAAAYLNAGGTAAGLTEAAAFSLRREAMRPDGTLDPNKFASWAQKRSSFLSALPDAQARFGAAADATRALDAGTMQSQLRLKEATKLAQRTIDDAVAARAAANKQVQDSAIGKFLSDAEPVTQLGKILSDRALGQAKAKQLAEAVSGDPDAQAGLRRAAAEYIERTFIGNAKGATSEEGAIHSARFQTFLKNNGRILSEVMTPADMSSLKSVAAAMERDYRSAQVGPGSQTAQLTAKRGTDLASQIGHHLAGMATGGSTGAAIGSFFGPAGAAAGGALGAGLNKVLQSAREAGLHNIEQLKAEALLNPALFRLLTSKVTPQNQASLLSGLAGQIGRIALVSGNSAAAAPSMPTSPRNDLAH